MFTTDGATPTFYEEEGMIERCIEIAIEEGVPVEEAYAIGSINAAKYFNLEHCLEVLRRVAQRTSISFLQKRIQYLLPLWRKENGLSEMEKQRAIT